MGSVQKYQTQQGPRYRVQYRKPNQKLTSKRGFRTKRDAELFLATVEVSKAAGTYMDPALARVTVRELGTRWLATKRPSMKASSYGPVEVAWRLRVEPRWGDVPLTMVTHSDVKAWVSELNTQHGPTVVIRSYGVLASILDDAVHDRRIPSNPARGAKVGLPRKMRGQRHTYLSHGQVETMANAAGTYATLVRTLAYTGIRWAEAVGLRVEDIDLGRSRLWVVNNAVELQGRFVEGTPKSHRAREVPVPRFLIAELFERVRHLDPRDLVFPGADGGFMKRTRASKGSRSWFRNAAAAAGAPTLTPHELRHTAASLAVQAGANVKIVQRMLGHSSAAMTLDIYADLFDRDLETVSDAMDRARQSELVAKTKPEPHPRYGPGL
jgi:integrase